MENYKLPFIQVQKSKIYKGVKIVPKAWLVEFYCGYGRGIVRKSKKHERMIVEFVAKVY